MADPTVLNAGRLTSIMIKANENEPAATVLVELFKTITHAIEWQKDEPVLHKVQIYIGKKALNNK
jgi:hypothetical protein